MEDLCDSLEEIYSAQQPNLFQLILPPTKEDLDYLRLLSPPSKLCWILRERQDSSWQRDLRNIACGSKKHTTGKVTLLRFTEWTTEEGNAVFITNINEFLITTRKWSIPDVEKHFDIKNVGNKGFSDAVNNASGDASGKLSFPTHHEGVGKNTSGKWVFPDAVNSASGATSGIGNRNRDEKKKGEEEVVAVRCRPSNFLLFRRRPSSTALAVVPRCRLPL
ncbi:hypothetical protein E5676_scaffold459G00600 [Cucumis melo var. makuwa]|uniref:Uncharacterized protein n=1 Tax=Cucumis melo var. makuwa TaxID=1194695 RepID=A0A5D3CFX7_CUCMM|nr:hypothetical protein E5676_scaffold459G00600 [Cucumis melo var. makuwa]